MESERKMSAQNKLSYEFLQNIKQELRTPVAKITTALEKLKTHYDELDEHEKLSNIAQISMDSEKLNCLINNIIDLSKLHSDYRLLIKSYNLTDLLYERVEFCKKIYIEDKDNKLWNFTFNLEKDIFVNCDKYYIGRVLDNIIINAMEYCINKKVNINLHRTNKGLVEFSITDQNLSVPKKYLRNVFESSVLNITKNKMLGIRLLFCQKVIKAHEGQIWTKESEKQRGVAFTFTIPSLLVDNYHTSS